MTATTQTDDSHKRTDPTTQLYVLGDVSAEGESERYLLLGNGEFHPDNYDTRRAMIRDAARRAVASNQKAVPDCSTLKVLETGDTTNVNLRPDTEAEN